jgi:hypothetical protein
MRQKQYSLFNDLLTFPEQNSSTKEFPGDFDACWATTNVDFQFLKDIEPVLLDLSNKCAAQKAKFGGELFPADKPTDLSGVTHLDFFQKDRDGNPKGIISMHESSEG